MTALDKLRERNRADVTLDSGLNVTIQLPALRECILAGGVPLPLLQKVVDNEGVEELSEEEVAKFQQFQRVLVAKAVVAIEGEATEMSTEDTHVLDDPEFYEIAAYAMREKPLPGKA